MSSRHHPRPAIKCRGPGPGPGLRSTTWLCSEEWEQVYAWLYSSDLAHVQEGLGRVAVWKRRGGVPMMVEMTSDLCECRLHDEQKDEGGGAHVQLEYSMAITRFVNGIGDIAKDRLKLSTNLLTCVHEYNIPSWVVTLRHVGTHEKLPSIAALRLGTEFCLNWLNANYWQPQKLTIAGGGGKGQSTITESSSALPQAMEKGCVGDGKEGRVWKLSRGLCQSRDQLIDTLTRSNYMELSDYMMNKHLLQFPRNIKCSVKGPSGLDTLCSLVIGKGDMKIWQTHLHKAAKQSALFKQTLISALIVSVNHSNCEASLSNFLCGWLNRMLSSCQQHQTGSTDVDIIHACDVADDAGGGDDVADNDGFVVGLVDWMELLNVSMHHPGIYSYAIMEVITQHHHLGGGVSNCTVKDNMMYLSNLITLSAKLGVGSYIKDHTHMIGRYLGELEAMCSDAQREGMSDTSSTEDAEVGLQEVNKRWRQVEDVVSWSNCPPGLYPGQIISAHMLDLPLQELNTDSYSNNEVGTASFVEGTPTQCQSNDVIMDDVIDDDIIPLCDLNDCQIIEVQQLIKVL